MRRLLRFIARLAGPTFEDWLLGALLVAVLALTVVGVRSCYEESVIDTPSKSVQEH